MKAFASRLFVFTLVILLGVGSVDRVQAASVSYLVDSDDGSFVREIFSFTLDRPVPYQVIDRSIVERVVLQFPEYQVADADFQITDLDSRLVEEIRLHQGKFYLDLQSPTIQIRDSFETDPYIVKIILEADIEQMRDVAERTQALMQNINAEFDIEQAQNRRLQEELSGAVQDTAGPRGLSPDELLQLELRDEERGIIDPYRQDEVSERLNTPDAIALRRGMLHLESGNYMEALDQFLIVIREYPESVLVEDATFHLGDCYRNIPQQPPSVQYRDAIEVYQRAMELYPDSRYVPKAIYGIAKSYEELGLDYEAKFHYEAIAEDYSLSEYAGPAQLAVADLEISQDNPKGALEALQRILDNYSEDTWRIEALKRMANIHFNMGNSQRSTEYYLRLRDEYPDFTLYDPRYMMNVGNAFFHDGKLSQAAEAYFKVINVFPNSELVPEALLQLSRVLVQADNPQMAEVYIDQLGGLYSESLEAAEGQLLAGDIKADTGEHEDALATYNMVDIGLHGQQLRDETLIRMARAEIQTGDYDMAYDHAGQILGSFPNSPHREEAQELMNEARLRKAQTMLEQDELQDAYDVASDLSASFVGDPENPQAQRSRDTELQAYYRIGEQMRQSNKLGPALEHFNTGVVQYDSAEPLVDSMERRRRELSLQIARNHMDDLEYADAIERLQWAREEFDQGYLRDRIEDRYVQALFEQGKFLFNNGNYEAGSRLFDRIFSEFSEHPRARQSREFLIEAGMGNVRYAYNRADYVNAIDQFQIYQPYLAEDPESYFEAGRMASQSYTRLGFHDRGLEHIDEMDANLGPEYDNRLDDLRALNYWGLRRYERLIDILEPRLEQGELMPEAYDVLARSYSETEQPEAAVDTYLRGAEVLDGAQGRKLRLQAVDLLLQRDRQPEARAQLELNLQGIKQEDTPDRTQTRSLRLLTDLQDSMDDLPALATSAARAAELVRDTDEQLRYRALEADALERQGDIAQALERWDAIVEDAPDSLAGMQARQKLQQYDWDNRMQEQLQ